MNKKAALILLCLVSLVLVILSFLTLWASSPENAGEVVIFTSGNPIGLYILTAMFLLASTVWYLIYRTQNRR